MLGDRQIDILDGSISKADKNRRKREFILIMIIALVIALLTFMENRIIHFGAGIPISSTILMFILININLLLLILLIFLVFRNLVKLIYARKSKVVGAKLRTRLVVAFIALSLMPTTVLFFFSINFITTSIEFWFDVPVEQALENSLKVGRSIYQHGEDSNRFFLERIAYQILSKRLLDPDHELALSSYIQSVQRDFNLNGVEVYSANANRLTYAINLGLENSAFQTVSADDLQQGLPIKGVKTISQTSSQGEFIKTIGTVPFGSKRTDAKGFVVLTLMIQPELSENMASISRGAEAYQQIKLLKKPIQLTYYITLSIVALLVVFCAVWFGFYLAKSITIPIMELAEGTRRVAEGDLSFAIAAVADDEIGSLVNSFNKMTKDLRLGRNQLELSAQKLREQNIEIEERRRYMATVLKNVSAGVITVDATGIITTFNKSAERMLNVEAADILDRSYRHLLDAPHLRLADEMIENLSASATGEIDVELPLHLTVSGRPRSFLATINALRDEAGKHMGIVMVIDDLTELEKAQRMAAWREVARRIAHEVKNPLTPITLSAQRLKRKYSALINEPVFDECTQMIINHVDLIRNLVNEFSAFARFPTADPKPCALAPIIEDTIALYREGHANICFRIDIEDGVPILNLDQRQIKQALINLVDNAVAAIKNQGMISIRVTYDPILKLVRVEVADNGMGIADEDKIRLFEPNFSTKRSGMGLGLTIVNSIISDHNGMIRVQDNPPQGAKFVIELPAA
jgi:two-component system nitrogen regulation sensor histidine kinase NtrY